MSSKRLTIFLVTLLLMIILAFVFYNNYHITSNTLELSGISSSKYALRIYDVSDNLLSCTTIIKTQVLTNQILLNML